MWETVFYLIFYSLSRFFVYIFRVHLGYFAIYCMWDILLFIYFYLKKVLFSFPAWRTWGTDSLLFPGIVGVLTPRSFVFCFLELWEFCRLVRLLFHRPFSMRSVNLSWNYIYSEINSVYMYIFFSFTFSILFPPMTGLFSNHAFRDGIERVAIHSSCTSYAPRSPTTRIRTPKLQTSGLSHMYMALSPKDA